MKTEIYLTLYFTVGVTYGLGRSYYWTNKLNDYSYTTEGKVYHPLTTSKKLSCYFISGLTSGFLLPLLCLNDLSYYEKNKFGVKKFIPSISFSQFKIEIIKFFIDLK